LRTRSDIVSDQTTIRQRRGRRNSGCWDADGASLPIGDELAPQSIKGELPELAIIVPTFNERDNIIPLLEKPRAVEAVLGIHLRG